MSKFIHVSEDEKERGHFYLDNDDQCLYLGLYHPDQNPNSGLNQHIWNFKKKPSIATTNPAEYRYKAPAIRTLANKLRGSFTEKAVNERLTFVPIPPSKARNDPEYDDRLVKLLQRMVTGAATPDIRDILSTKRSRTASHSLSSTFSSTAVADLQATIDIQIPANFQPRKYIILVDDVLRRGTHFKACKNLIKANFPDTHVAGVFLARTNY